MLVTISQNGTWLTFQEKFKDIWRTVCAGSKPQYFALANMINANYKMVEERQVDKATLSVYEVK